MIPQVTQFTQATVNSEIRYLGKSEAIRNLIKQANIAAKSDLGHVIVTGPVGSGKSFLASYIHSRSRRSEKKIMFIDCGGIPSLSSELFGFRRGAFTGAEKNYLGRLMAADGGTIVLDDAERLTHEEQDLLHRVVETGSFYPLGQEYPVSIDVRFIATTNQILDKAVSSGTLKYDFVSRLNYFELNVPSLEERIEDIPVICKAIFNEKYERLVKKKIISDRSVCFDSECWPVIQGFKFDDNIRGLDKMIVRLLACLGDKERISVEDILESAPSVFTEGKESNSTNRSLRLIKEEAEREHIIKVCQQTRFNITQAAKILSISRKALYTKLSMYGIARP